MLTKENKIFLINLVKEIIRCELTGEKFSVKCPDDAIFRKNVGAFVTLKKQGQLRGCIGYVIGYKTLFETILDMSKAAAFNDPRFNSVKENEISELEVEISILSELINVENINEIEIGRDGLIISKGYYQGLLLPQVAVEWGWNREQFLSETCRKAGMHGDCWKEKDVIIKRFTAEVFSEKELSDS